jgi:hypothetical protein
VAAYRTISNVETELLEKVSKEQLMEFTKEISKEVRLSGTEEELRAFEYAKGQLESFGMSTELLFSESYISLPRNASLQVGGKEYDCITHSMGQSVDGLESHIVDLGKGSAEEYGADDVKGKVVLMNGLATPAGVQKAEANGAVAAVFVNAEYTHEMIVSPVWGTPVPETVDLLPKIPVLSVDVKNGQFIRDQISAGNSQCILSAGVETGFRSIPTLTAEIKGSEEPEKFILFSGHIDSWHFGVMDNGTANATMLEIARILSQYNGNFKRTLRFAFWSGHSHGRYAGSAWYCDTHWEDLTENCVLHVNIDSVGAKGATVLTESNCMTETSELARDAIGALTGEHFEGGRFGRAGDQSFWGTGTPSIFMGLSEQEPSTGPAAEAFGQLFGGGKSGGFGWWWHTTEDTLDKIDPDNLKRDCEIYLAIIYRSLTEPIIPVNQLAAIEEIEDALKEWQEKARGVFDLTVAVERSVELKNKAQQLQEVITRVDKQDVKAVAVVNEVLMELSRILVPLNYVKGSIFDHDLALKQPKIPKLAALDDLNKTDKSENKYQFILNYLLRSRNEVNYSLKQATKVINQALQNLV